MPPPRFLPLPLPLALAGLLLAVVACDQPPPDPPPAVSAEPRADSAPNSPPASLARSTYDPALGDLLVLPLLVDGALSSSVALLSPRQSPELPVTDTAGLRQRLGDGRMELFSRAGKVGDGIITWDDTAPGATDGATDGATLVAVADPTACAAWPSGRWASSSVSPDPAPPGTAPRLPADPLSAKSRLPRWLVALPNGRARAIPLDSIEALGSRDSSTLAATFARLASALPADSSSPFRGLPFTVQRAYRALGATVSATESAGAALPPAQGFVVGVLVRRIPQEDRPLEERLLVVIATPGADPRRWSIVWHERTSGREEEVIATEPLAALRVGSESPYTALILGRDDGSGASLAVLERRGDLWRVRWESPVTGC